MTDPQVDAIDNNRSDTRRPRLIWLAYLLVGLVVWSSAISILNRASDPMWEHMSESRRNYDLISVGVAIYALIVGYGIFRRKEWGRVFGISLAVIVLFMFVGTRLIAPLLTSGAVPVELGWEAVVMGLLSIGCIVALSSRSFRATQATDYPR